MKYKIEVERKNCIVCGSCYSLNSSHFEPDSEGKSMVIGGETDVLSSMAVFDDAELENVKDAEDSRPVSIISVKVVKKYVHPKV